MSLTGLSVLLAVVILNIHLYGSSLKPVPRRLRRIIFYHIAPFLRVQLHRLNTTEERKARSHSNSNSAPRRTTTVYNAIFLNENDFRNFHTVQSTRIHENPADPNSTTFSNLNSIPQSLDECRKLLIDLNRLLIRPTENQDDEFIIREWQNVALVLDRCLFIIYLFLTGTLTIGTLILAPLMKSVPEPPNYHELNITQT